MVIKYIKSGGSPSSSLKTTSSYIAAICFVQLNGGFGSSVEASMTIDLQYANLKLRYEGLKLAVGSMKKVRQQNAATLEVSLMVFWSP